MLAGPPKHAEYPGVIQNLHKDELQAFWFVIPADTN